MILLFNVKFCFMLSFSLFKEFSRCFYKRLFRKPIYRVDVLRLSRVLMIALNNRRGFLGLCPIICSALRWYGFNVVIADLYRDGYERTIGERFGFSLYSLEEARRFGAFSPSLSKDGYDGYWWKPGDLSSGRLAYLDWLIRVYTEEDEHLVDLYSEIGRKQDKKN
jgi:hypothetical protein